MQSMNDLKRRILIIDDNSRLHADYRKILEGEKSREETNEDYLGFFGTAHLGADFGNSDCEPLKGLIKIDSAMQGEDGVDMVKQAREEGNPFQLAFVDLRMPPGWDGLKTVEEIWKVDPAVQIVICSAYSDNSYTDICKRLGRSDSLLILRKPFDAIEVYQLAVALTEKWILGKEALLKREDLEKIVEQRTRELRQASLIDPLTKLKNRTGFNIDFDNAVTRSKRSGTRVTVFLVDLDFFKDINDTYGHPVGDALLIEVSRRLTECTRETDTVARLGGDEFVVLQPDVESNYQFRGLLRRLEEIQKVPWKFEQWEIGISFSIGVVICPDDGANTEDLLKKADLALYRAKKEGRGTSRCYASGMDEDVAHTRAVYQGLQVALREQEFMLHFQPIVNACTGKLFSFEALLRWVHPKHGMVPPDQFIPVAEETGIIVPIGDWVLESACRSALLWPEDIGVAVNMSPVQLREHHDVVSHVTKIVELTGFDPNRLTIEITETTPLLQQKYTIDCLQKFQKLGIKIALDDFGVGHSSLSYLQSFAFDKLKLDRSFVSSKFSSSKTRAIMKLVGSLGINLNIPTTAEGVETIDELKLVQQEGFTFAQGYLFGRPEPHEELSKYFKTNAVQLDVFKSAPTGVPCQILRLQLPDVSNPESSHG